MYLPAFPAAGGTKPPPIPKISVNTVLMVQTRFLNIENVI